VSNSVTDRHPILDAAVELGPQIRAARAEIEETRRLPSQIVDAMKRAGIFGMAMPREWGGPELDPLTQLRIIEALSAADASVGWCAMIGCDSGYFTAFLDQRVAREMYPDISESTASSTALTGRAVRVAGGYRVSGRWPFASGCHHAAWLVGNCVVYADGAQLVRPNGAPETRMCFLMPADCKILDTWHTTGMRGSGSADFSVEDCFVPEERTFSFQELAVKREGALYRFPFAFLLKAAAPATGLARETIDAFVATAAPKASRQTIIGGKLAQPRLLRDEPFVQSAVGKAEALLDSARSYLFDVVGEFWDLMVSGKRLGPRQAVRFNLVSTHVYSACTEAVQLIYRARGGSAVFTNAMFDRFLRDAITMNQHVLNSLKNYERAGRLLLGAEPEEFLI
jgi:alkylation response protein AidB-like acyl-CoA dehydrogenase